LPAESECISTAVVFNVITTTLFDGVSKHSPNSFRWDEEV